jgi:hypothetical protein
MERSRTRADRFASPLLLSLALAALAACGPQLDPNPQTLDFKQVYVGTMAGQNGTWRNSGNANATIANSVLTIAGANAAQFAGGIPAPPPIIVAKGAALAPPAGFGFTPNAVGPFTATATPTVAEANATVNAMTLQGEGIMQLNRGSLVLGGQPLTVGQPVNFGRVRVGAAPSIVTLNLQNTFMPAGAVRITKVQFQMNNQGFTYVGPPTPFNIPANGTVAVRLQFAPPAWNPPPLEKKFRDGVTFFEVATDTLGNITASASGTALCGVGFHLSENPPNPPMVCP